MFEIRLAAKVSAPSSLFSRRRPSARPRLLPAALAVLLSGTLFAAPGTPVRAGEFTLETEKAPLAVTVSARSTSLLRMAEDRIRSAVFDKTLMDIQTDRETGSVYVLPKSEGEAVLYLTAESGDTAALALRFDFEADPKSIVLQKKGAQTGPTPDDRDDARLALRPLAAEGYPAELKRFVTLVFRDETTSGEILRSASLTPGPAARRALSRLASLHVTVTGRYRSERIEGLRVRLTNGGLKPVLLDARALTVPGLYAAALTATQLAPGETAELLLLEGDRHD